MEPEVVDIDDWEPEDPLWMTKLPDSFDDNINLTALQSLLYDDQSPEEIAENFKERGNECFVKGKAPFLQDAVKFYTKAIDQPIQDVKKRSVYYGNRAAANLQIGNNRLVIDDSDEAIKLDKTNIKAYFRAAKAYQNLHLYQEAIQYCDSGLLIEPGNKTLNREKQASQKKLKQQTQIKKKQEDKAKEEERLNSEIEKRAITLGVDLFENAKQYTQNSKIYMDNDMILHWPVLFVYEEHGQVDFIEDFSEDSTFQQHLEVMFPPNECCDWDTRKEYSYPDLEVYAILNQVEPKKRSNKERGRPKKIRINHNTTLSKVLKHPEYVVPGIPIFYVIPSKGFYKDKFIKMSIEDLNKLN